MPSKLFLSCAKQKFDKLRISKSAIRNFIVIDICLIVSKDKLNERALQTRANKENLPTGKAGSRPLVGNNRDCGSQL